MGLISSVVSGYCTYMRQLHQDASDLISNLPGAKSFDDPSVSAAGSGFGDGAGILFR